MNSKKESSKILESKENKPENFLNENDFKMTKLSKLSSCNDSYNSQYWEDIQDTNENSKQKKIANLVKHLLQIWRVN